MESRCELHVHLEGCVWPRHMRTWWARSEQRFPEPRSRRGDPFGAFLDQLRYGYNFLNTAQAYAEVAALYAEEAIREGIVYAELQVNLALVNAWSLQISEVLQRIHERVEKEKTGSDTAPTSVPSAPQGFAKPPTLRFIIDLPWQFDAGMFREILDDAAHLRALGVRAISLGGRESDARSHEVAPICDEARANGFEVVCHAGETASSEQARHIVEALRPSRIAHAVTLADWIAEQGNASPPVDVCLSSNLATGAISDLHAHPLRRWWDAGVAVCLSTDDPAIFETSLSNEYALAARLCPSLATGRDRLIANWLRAATDRDAAAAALGIDESPGPGAQDGKQ